MDRRGILAGGAAAAALATPAIAQGRIEWRMVTLWPRNLPGPGVAAQRVADRIGAVTGGRRSSSRATPRHFMPPDQQVPCRAAQSPAA